MIHQTPIILRFEGMEKTIDNIRDIQFRGIGDLINACRGDKQRLSDIVTGLREAIWVAQLRLDEAINGPPVTEKPFELQCGDQS